jgi:SAM-dependent methyltransferase
MYGAGRLSFDPAREEAELKAYLGDGYARADLERYEDLLEEEVASTGDEGELYRTSRSYLYNLTAFAMSGTKLPYLEILTRVVPPGSRVLDYGCGIGSDGLILLEAGYQVEFADFDNPSTEYLRWRLEQRSLDAPIHDLDRDVPGGFDAAYAFDVIEHVPDPYGFLQEMESRAGLVMVNLLEFGPHEQTLHYELPIKRLLARAAHRRLEFYGLLHRTSHLVAYGPEKVGLRKTCTNAARIVRHSKLNLVTRRRSSGSHASLAS